MVLMSSCVSSGFRWSDEGGVGEGRRAEKGRVLLRGSLVLGLLASNFREAPP